MLPNRGSITFIINLANDFGTLVLLIRALPPPKIDVAIRVEQYLSSLRQDQPPPTAPTSNVGRKDFLFRFLPSAWMARLAAAPLIKDAARLLFVFCGVCIIIINKLLI